MNKFLKMSLVVIGGVIGAYIVISVLGTSAGSLQEASARGETFGVILGVILFAGIGMPIAKSLRRK